MENETRCVVCRGMTVARQYIRLVPIGPPGSDPHDQEPNRAARGDPIYVHLRHKPAEVMTAIAGREMDLCKLTYNPPKELGAMQSVVPAWSDLEKTIQELRDKLFAWLRKVPKDLLVQCVAVAACADDSWRPELMEIARGKTDDEILERCMRQPTIERIKEAVANSASEATA